MPRLLRYHREDGPLSSPLVRVAMSNEAARKYGEVLARLSRPGSIVSTADAAEVRDLWEGIAEAQTEAGYAD